MSEQLEEPVAEGDEIVDEPVEAEAPKGPDPCPLLNKVYGSSRIPNHMGDGVKLSAVVAGCWPQEDPAVSFPTAAIVLARYGNASYVLRTSSEQVLSAIVRRVQHELAHSSLEAGVTRHSEPEARRQKVVIQ